MRLAVLTGGLAARLPAAPSTTPEALRLRSRLLVANAVCLALLGSLTIIWARGAVEEIGLRTVPALIDAQAMHATLADADRAAADAFLTGVGITPAERRYDADIQVAGNELEQASEHNGAGGAGAGQLQVVIAQVAAYRGLIDTARAGSRELFPVGAAYLRLASSLMHRPGDGILARVDALGALYARNLRSDDLWLWPVVLGFVAVPLAVGLMLLQARWLQRFIRLRFRRRRSRPLGVAVAVLWLFLALVAGQATTSYLGLVAAEEQALPRLQAMWQARSLAADADGNESLSLIARGNGAANDAAFSAETSQLAALLAREARAAGLPGERPATLAVDSAYRRLLTAGAAVRQRATAGDYDGATALALGSAGGDSLTAAYAGLDSALARLIALLRRQFDAAIGLATPSQAMVAVVPCLAGMVAGLLVRRAVAPRLAEYAA